MGQLIFNSLPVKAFVSFNFQPILDMIVMLHGHLSYSDNIRNCGGFCDLVHSTESHLNRRTLLIRKQQVYFTNSRSQIDKKNYWLKICGLPPLDVKKQRMPIRSNRKPSPLSIYLSDANQGKILIQSQQENDDYKHINIEWLLHSFGFCCVFFSRNMFKSI